MEMGLGVENEIEISDLPDVADRHDRTGVPGVPRNAFCIARVNWPAGNSAVIAGLGRLEPGDAVELELDDGAPTGPDAVDMRVTGASRLFVRAERAS